MGDVVAALHLRDREGRPLDTFTREVARWVTADGTFVPSEGDVADRSVAVVGGGGWVSIRDPAFRLPGLLEDLGRSLSAVVDEHVVSVALYDGRRAEVSLFAGGAR